MKTDGNEAGFQKIHRISWLTEKLLASQEELCATQLRTSSDHRANAQNYSVNAPFLVSFLSTLHFRRAAQVHHC
jgi:hypothetical protein